jgi:hypothetical protein
LFALDFKDFWQRLLKGLPGKSFNGLCQKLYCIFAAAVYMAPKVRSHFFNDKRDGFIADGIAML